MGSFRRSLVFDFASRNRHTGDVMWRDHPSPGSGAHGRRDPSDCHRWIFTHRGFQLKLMVLQITDYGTWCCWHWSGRDVSNVEHHAIQCVFHVCGLEKSQPKPAWLTMKGLRLLRPLLIIPMQRLMPWPTRFLRDPLLTFGWVVWDYPGPAYLGGHTWDNKNKK